MQINVKKKDLETAGYSGLASLVSSVLLDATNLGVFDKVDLCGEGIREMRSENEERNIETLVRVSSGAEMARIKVSGESDEVKSRFESSLDRLTETSGMSKPLVSNLMHASAPFVPKFKDGYDKQTIAEGKPLFNKKLASLAAAMLITILPAGITKPAQAALKLQIPDNIISRVASVAVYGDAIGLVSLVASCIKNERDDVNERTIQLRNTNSNQQEKTNATQGFNVNDISKDEIKTRLKVIANEIYQSLSPTEKAVYVNVAKTKGKQAANERFLADYNGEMKQRLMSFYAKKSAILDGPQEYFLEATAKALNSGDVSKGIALAFLNSVRKEIETDSPGEAKKFVRSVQKKGGDMAKILSEYKQDPEILNMCKLSGFTFEQAFGVATKFSDKNMQKVAYEPEAVDYGGRN